MIEMLKNWYNRRFSDPQAMGLAAILLFGFIAIYFFSNLIAGDRVGIFIGMAGAFIKWKAEMPAFIGNDLSYRHVYRFGVFGGVGADSKLMDADGQFIKWFATHV